jgi:hypothetical protein
MFNKQWKNTEVQVITRGMNTEVRVITRGMNTEVQVIKRDAFFLG